MKTTIIPYLNFNGNCAEAMKFYQSIFGGDLDISPDKKSGRTIHASLKSADIQFMASDGDPKSDVVFGDSVSLSINGTDDAKITEYFEKLSKGGKIFMKLEKQFWGDKFGLLVDKYKIQWMVNISSK